MKNHHRNRLARTTWLALAAMLSVGCASNKSKSAPEDSGPEPVGVETLSDGSHVVRLSDGRTLRPYEEGTRYITTFGLPADIRVTPPDWIVNPGIDGLMGAVGIAPDNDLGTREQIEEARTSGRLELAQMLETRIQKIGRSDLEQYIQASRSSGQLAHDNQSRKSNLGVQRDITDLVISGSRQRALWFDPISGDCYVWVVMDGGIKTKATQTLENGVSVYVASQPITSEYRPEYPTPPKPEAAPAPAPVVQPKTGIEKLEERLKPIETIPVKPKG